MKRFPELRPNGWDLMVLAVVLMLALGSAWTVWGGTGDTDHLRAVIFVDGAEVETVDLSQLSREEERIIQANGYTLHLEVRSTGVRVRDADCPTQDCVHTGSITHSGQSIVCLPARVSVQLMGAETTDSVDVVIG